MVGMNDKELKKFALDFRKGILGKRSSTSQCFNICAPLSTLLDMHGVENKVVRGEVGEYGNHYWIELADGRILDPTADQFNVFPNANFPKVFLGTVECYQVTQV